MKLLKARTFKGALIHVGIILALTVTLVLIFFYCYLPGTTNHGETITLPDLQGMHESELGEFLSSRNLRYEIRSDSGYSEDYPPLTALNQHPKPGAKVKENRKIYITLNARRPPIVRMPDLIDGSLSNADRILTNIGLVRGAITYEPDPAENAVLKQLYKGKEVQPGDSVPKGSSIELVIGDGLGKRVFAMHDLVGMELDEAEVLILGSKLKVGSLLNQEAEEEFTGVVMRQAPPPGSDTRSGQLVDLWVGNLHKYDSINAEQDSAIAEQMNAD